MDLLRCISLRQFQSPFVRKLAVQFSGVRITNINQQQWHGVAETTRPLPNPHESEWPGAAGMPECLWCASLKEVKISEEEGRRATKRCRTSYSSLLSLLVESWLHSLQTSLVLPWVLPQQNTKWICITLNNITEINVHYLLILWYKMEPRDSLM